MKILLISANQCQEPYPVYPLGLAYLKAFLLRHLEDADVEIVDMNLMDEPGLRLKIKEYDPDYIGVSFRNVDGANSLVQKSFFSGYKRVVDVVRDVSHAPLIIGGPAFSIFPEFFMRELDADYGIKGEGEASLCRLIEALHSRKPVSGIPALYDRGGKCGGGVSYIDSPAASYEGYLTEYYWKASGMLNIQTKRGCPYSCIYCTYPLIDGCKVRTMDIGMIVDTILRAKRDYGVNYWFFTDSVFNIRDDYNMALAQALIDNHVDISWGAYFSPLGLTEEKMALFKASGLSHMEFGTESFCDRTLAAYGKAFGFDEVLKASGLALKYNVYYAHFLILGGYGETHMQLEQTIENSRYLRHTVIFPYVGMRIYPGTWLHEHLVAQGLCLSTDDLVEPAFYVAEDFDLEYAKAAACATGKAWFFPDTPQDRLVETLRLKKNKKGPLWEYLRKA